MNTAIGNAIQALKDRVEDCYTAVDNKGGTIPVAQSDRNTTNLPTAIASIPSGGGSPVPNDFNFVDCFGLQQSYSKAEIDAMTEMPTPKSYNGLTFDGWSRTLAELKALSCCTIGAYYKPSNNNTRIKIYIPNDNFEISISTNSTGRTIDWGDGEASAVQYYNSHIYAKSGYYYIEVDGATTLAITPDSVTQKLIEELYISTDLITLATQSLRNASRLKVLCIPKSCTAYNFLSIYNLSGEFLLKSLVLPSFITGPIMGNYSVMSAMTGLEYFVIDGATTYGIDQYNRPYSLISFSAKNVTSTNNGHSSTPSPNLRYVVFDNITTISHAIFGTCWWIKILDLPSTIQTISNFNYTIMENIYIRAITPPAMSGLSADTYCKIHIPANAEYTDGNNVTWYGVEAYEHATNWSAFTGKYIADL